MSKVKSTFLTNIEYYFFRIFIFCTALIPLSLAYLITTLLTKFIFLIDKKHRERAISHILHAKVAKNRKDAIKIAKQSFISIAKTFVEVFKCSNITNPENIKKHFTITGSNKAKELFLSDKNKQNVIVVTAHYGNWELAGGALTVLSNIPMTSVMRPLNNNKIGEYLYKKREKHGHKICAKDGAIRTLLSTLRKGGSIGLISDQHAGHLEGVEVEFFNEPVRSHTSSALLHLKTGVPIFVFVMKRIDNKLNFEIKCADPIMYTPTDDKEQDIINIVQEYNNKLQSLIADAPEQWLWSHRRWLNINRKKLKK